MKKFMASLVCLGLLTGSMASAVMGPKEFWRCLTNKETCPESKRKEARAWIIGVPVAVVLATLAAVGIIVTKDQVEKMKAEKKQEEAAAATAQAEQDKKQAQYSDLGLKIKYLEDDLAVNKTKLQKATSAAEKAKIQGVIDRTQKEIDTMKDTQELLTRQMAPSLFKRTRS